MILIQLIITLLISHYSHNMWLFDTVNEIDKLKLYHRLKLSHKISYLIICMK